MNKCSNCNHDLKPGKKFCTNCGTKVKRVPIKPVQPVLTLSISQIIIGLLGFGSILLGLLPIVFNNSIVSTISGFIMIIGVLFIFINILIGNSIAKYIGKKRFFFFHLILYVSIFLILLLGGYEWGGAIGPLLLYILFVPIALSV